MRESDMSGKKEEKTALDWYNGGYNYFEYKRYQKAIDCFKKAIEIDPSHRDFWHEKGCAYNRLKK
jgi:tetratricopeptide (TPR) repeat protein